jgi:hypothetical protein
MVPGLGLAIFLLSAIQSTGGSAPLAPLPGQVQGAFDRVQTLAALRKQIAGRERESAEAVFKNIKDYKGVPAAGLLRGMEFYVRALGVDCTHCHVVNEWEKDEKHPKQIAREMSALVDSIQVSLRKIPNIKSDRPGISCATCHRGQIKPAISMTP